MTAERTRGTDPSRDARREAERALRASEAKFATAFACSPLALVISALDDGRLLEVNEGFVRLSGWTREEAVGRSADELGLWLDPELRARGLERLRAGQPAPETEARFRTRSGDERVGVISAALVEIDGRTCVLSSVTDVTERKQAERLLVEQKRLLELVASGRPLRECLGALCEAVPRLAPRAFACMLLADAAGGKLGSAIAAPAEEPFARAIAEQPDASGALLGGEPIAWAELAADARGAGGVRALCAAHGVRALHAAPVNAPDGRPLGSFLLCFAEPREPGDTERRLAEFGVRLASIALERDRAAAALRENQARLAGELAALLRLQETSTQLISRGDVDALYGSILDAALAVSSAEFGSLQVLHPEADELRLQAQRGFDAEAERFFARVRSTDTTGVGLAVRTRKRLLIPDIERHASRASGEQLRIARRLGIRALQVTPLFSREGHLLGVISTHWRRPHRPSEHDLQLLDVLARQASDLIERSQAAAALRTSEERYRSLTGVLTSLVWTTDASGAFVTEQAEWAAFTGQAFEAHRGWGWLDAIHPEDRDAMSGLWREALASKRPYESSGRLWHATSGAHRHVVARAVPLLDADGAVREWIGTVSDVHEQTQAEADLNFLAELSERSRAAEEAEALMAEVVEALAGHLHLARCFFAHVDDRTNRWRIAGDYHGALPSIAGDFPVSSWETDGILAAREGSTRSYEDTQLDPRTAANHAKRYEPLGARAMVIVPLHREGRRVSNLAGVSDRPRRWQPREIALLEAVAERTWSAVEKLRLTAELRESEARFRNMADHAPVMIWVSDPDGRCSYLSQSWRDFTGQAVDAGGAFCWLAAAHPDDRAAAERAFRDAAAKREAFQMEYRLRRSDAAHRWALDAALPRVSEQGEFLGYIGSIIDITERRQAEEALREADRRKDEFLAMLAHELRNPLAPIRNAAHVLKLAPSQVDQAWALDVVERQIQHLTRLVDDLLDVSRITRGKVALQRERLDVSAILERAVETIRPLVEARRQHMAVSLPVEPLRVEGDVTRLVQVVGNLLNNAAKYTPEGGHIRIEAAAEGGDAVVRVRDDGIGLPADLLPHVFDLFTQADRSLDRSQGGLGIGLTVVRSLVERHGGRVEARSEGPGRGSEFAIRLPALPGEAEEQPPPSGRSAAPGRRLRVLVVEDHADSAEMMAFLLKLDGHEVRTAHDGREALAAAHAFRPEVVLCDIGLPGMTGYEVAARLRAERDFEATRLIAVSGYGREEDRRRAREAGFDAHLTKPVAPEALGALLESLRPPSA